MRCLVYCMSAIYVIIIQSCSAFKIVKFTKISIEQERCLMDDVHMVAVFGVEPDLTREGGSIPVTLTLQETTGKSVMLLPIGACDDGAHSQNEKIDRSNYIQGVSASRQCGTVCSTRSPSIHTPQS